MNIYAQAAGGAYRRHYNRVSKQAVAFRVHSSFGTTGCLQLLEIYWNLKTLLEILEILKLMVILEIFV